MPLNIQVPAPDLVKVPVPLITPEAVIVPVHEKVAAVERTISPEAVAADALLLASVPLMVNCSEVVVPFKSRVAPDAMVVLFAVPNALLFPITILPALTVVNPEYVLVPDKVSEPVPVLVMDKEVAVPFSIKPENVVLELSPPDVNVMAPELELVTVPAPANDPMVSL